MKKKRNLALTGITLLCSLTLLACQQKQAQQVASEKVKQEQVQKEEIVYVVAELTEDGYVLIHGDHQHLEKGSVPYDAKFLKETLLEDKNYQFNEKDVLYKVRTGYIIQVKGKVYYYPKKTGDGLVTLEEARKLTANNPEHDHHGHDHNHDHAHEEQKQSSTNLVGVAGIDRPTSDGFLLSDAKQISSKTDTGIIVEHNGHSHFIFYGDLKGSKWEYLIPAGADVTKKQENSASGQSSSQAGQDHYQFNPADIVAEDANGYTVRHGDHYHYILKQTVGGSVGNPVHTGASQFASSKAAAPVMQNHLVTLPVSPIANLPVPVVTAGANQAASVVSRQGIAGIDYPTSDGFLFDGSGLIGQNAVGLLIQHQGHIHVLRREQVATSKWAYLLEDQSSQATPIQPLPAVLTNVVTKPVEKTEVVASSQSPAPSPAPVTPAEATVADEVTAKRNYLAQALGLPVNSITLLDTPQGQAFMYPHGDHDHLVLLKNIDLTKPFESEEEEHSPSSPSASETTSSSSEQPTSSSPSSSTTSSQATSEPEATTPTSPSLSEVTEAPHSAPVTPTEATVVDEVEDKRNYLAQALGLPVNSITLLDTPQGQAFMYPHGDHDHLVLLKNIDLTKPFESEEEEHSPSSSSASATTSSSSEQPTSSITLTSTTSSQETSEPAATTPTSPSLSEVAEAPHSAPVAPTAEVVADEVTAKRNYLAQALGLPVNSITLLDTPQGQAFMYPHGDHDHLVLLKNIDLTKPFESEEEEYSPSSSSASATTSSSSEQPTSSSTSTPTTSSQETSEPEATTTTSPSLSEVTEAPHSAPVTPAEVAVVDEVADKRNYLAQALGLPVNSITLLDTPQGQAFMYPHGDHDHLVLLKNIDLTKPFESEEDLARKIDYISKVYGVPKEAIRVSDTTFSFNDPSHAYDPTHVHPYVILRSMLIIPEVTGDPETDFEAELLAVAKRTGIAPSKLIIRDKKFILPHGSHDHVLHIQAVEGIEPYLANKLPAIAGSYQEGEFDRATVDSQLAHLRQVAAEKYGTSSKEYRRIERALEDFASNLDDLVTNSTKGYLAMLEQFEKVHILKETTSNTEEQVDPLYQSVLEQIRLLDTSNLPVNKEDLTSQLNQASQDKDRQALLNLEHLLQELKHFQDRPDITAMEYMDYLLSQLDQPYLPADLQERLASTLDRLFQATLGGNGSIKPLDLSKELVDLKVALHLAKAANQTYPIQTSPASEKLQENRAFMEAFVGDIREMFTRQMTFPEIVEKTENETPVTSPSQVTDNQTYQELLTLLRQTNLTGTQTSQTAWVERINQASLKGDERELASISHSLKEIQHFQDRAEIRLMEYMDYLLTHIDSPYLQAPTRQEAARLINQIYGLVVRRELATSPISLAEDLIASSIAVANDVKGQINQQLEMSDDYGIMQMNRLEMNMFVEGTRDFFVDPLSLPEEVLVKAGQTRPVPAIEEGVGAASPTNQDRPESSFSPIHDHESGSKEVSPSSLSQAVEENSSSETGSSSEQAISPTELVEAEAVVPTNSDVLVSEEESASSDGSKPTEVQEIPSPTEETNASSAPASEPSSPAAEEQVLPSETAEEEEVELSDEDLEWLSDIFGEFTGSTSEEESEDIGLTWKPLGSFDFNSFDE
ncbi:pneumococcal-type histidine triad protein [Streptococcus suis]|uniref:pneumococcal-type histidine triad protein n=1 Tax=Streptococcus suis TaxID=1307 RepID=UPI000CF48313|nr:pneumococcal-type histidine triad protein [Streptococcus suis]